MKIKREKNRVVQKIRQLPLFWSNLILMFCIVILAGVILISSNNLYQQALSERYLSDTQKMLEYNCNNLSEKLYMTYAIPSAMEDTSSYNYISTVHSGTLPKGYDIYLPFISQSLKNQQFLLQNNEECLVYLSGSNAVCTRMRNFSRAEDCFTEYMKFSELTGEEVMSLLKSRNIVKLLQMQDVSLGNGKTDRELALIVHPVGAKISVMTLYSEDTIISMLGLSALPESTYACITDRSGTILWEYPERITEEVRKTSYSVHSSLKHLKADVTIWVPYTYFLEQTADAVRAGWLMFALMVIIGIFLCVLFSRISTNPIQKLFKDYAKTDADVNGTLKRTNEVAGIAEILADSGNQIENLKKALSKQLFVLACSGSVLSEKDDSTLAGCLSGIQTPYRMISLFTDGAEETVEMFKLLDKDLSEVFIAMLGMQELGVLISDQPEELETVRQVCSLFPNAACGISTSFQNLSKIQDAVREARLCRPSNGLAIYSGRMVRGPFPWELHERLHQSLINNQQARCLEIIQAIGKEVEYRSEEAFYAIRYVLHSVSNETDLFIPEIEETEYAETLTFEQNIDALVNLAKLFFAAVSIKKENPQKNEADRILGWIDDNCADCNLSVPMIMEQFSISEKRLYSLIRSATGKSIQEYILSVRMCRVARQLITTDDEVLEIAQRCGYPSASTFYRVFKKYFGVTTTQYREDHSKNGVLFIRESDEADSTACFCKKKTLGNEAEK